MIHEIAPDTFDNQYKKMKPGEESPVLLFHGKTLFRLQGDGLDFPVYRSVKSVLMNDPVYLFTVSGQPFFLGVTDEDKMPGLTAEPFMCYRDKRPTAMALAAMTGIHLFNWYRAHRFCGVCGHEAVHDEKERMMRCPACGNLMFPRIAPAVIVAVTDGERLLVTKYAHQNNAKYALVAGFVEIGETSEECVAREVMEEVGLKLKNIRYYDSQPWGFAGNLMLGYTAELDGSDMISLDRNELSKAVWLRPEEIPENEDVSSLTREMIRRFANKKLFSFQENY